MIIILILGLLLLGLIFFRDKFRSKIILNSLYVIVASLLLYRLYFLVYIIFGGFYFEKQFDPEIWKSYPYERYKMAQNISNDNLFINSSVSEIKELLGKPENLISPTIWGFSLGTKEKFGIIDPDVMLLYIQDSTVVSVRILCEGKIECYK